MTRALRIKIPGGLYHIYTRGIDRNEIFQDEYDKEKFLEILQKCIRDHAWKCYAYCLMKNHFHILIESADGDTSRGMRQLNGVYAQYFNWKHDRVGPLFQGRYKAILVDRENYFLELCRYIVLNPVRAGIVKSPDEYPWSSYRATTELDQRENFVDWKAVLSRFSSGRDNWTVAIASYTGFVNDRLHEDSSSFEVKGNLILGDKKFVESLKDDISKHKDNPDFPKYQRNICRPELEELFDPLTVSMKITRNEAVRRAHNEFGYLPRDIAEFLKINYSTVYRIIKSDY
jgi:putative transposase